MLRCNQCTAAPCVTICPTVALTKREDGVVDVDPLRCIGCKSCMQACPYDALYIHPDQGTAQKCHFCVHRTERGLAPACAIVCPTEAIIPGDFDDPESVVATMRATGELTARKTEAGTGPNVFYREVEPAGIQPLETNAAGGYLWANQLATAQLEADVFEALDWRAREGSAEGDGRARTTYDVQHGMLWGEKVSAYLFFKALASGIFLAAMLLITSPEARNDTPETAQTWAFAAALAFLGITVLLLILDLKRPERFWYMLKHPNWDSWLVRGGIILAIYGALLASWLLFPWSHAVHFAATVLFAALTAMYTAWLFRQCKGRVLWLQRFLAVRFLVHAIAGGAAFWLLLGPGFALPEAFVLPLRITLGVSLLVIEVLHLTDHGHAPAGRRPEYEKALRLLSDGPWAARQRWITQVIGGVVPIVLVIASGNAVVLAVAGALALIGLYNEQDVFVEAGQAQPIH